jgi:hypothetical protein
MKLPLSSTGSLLLLTQFRALLQATPAVVHDASGNRSTSGPPAEHWRAPTQGLSQPPRPGKHASHLGFARGYGGKRTRWTQRP